ncbi:ABC transporter ATP-binding protein [Dysosmobacter sp.]|uniref:ABC transporter ATP-binding protein n=1 Tax=Dysosmobacter sp. TaxID=2591382 RepID=UPI0028474BE0|nr:ABC transporter ATP-binding protein [Dysosmobacter sp.]MDR4032739.1 ABC transporter ATP-binding protein [Dysosmobacter sp.]
MKQKKTNRVALLLHWAGEQKVWLFLAVLLAMTGGLCIVVPYIEIYRLMDAAFGGTCTEELVVRVVAAVAAAVVLRFVLFGASGVVSHKGAYGALFKVRCMVAEHMAKVPLGALNERRTGDIKTVLNEDIEKLELFLAHNLPEFVAYLTGPVVIFLYLLSVNVPLALVSLLPLPLAGIVMGVIFGRMKGILEDANRSLVSFNSVMIEYVSGMRLIKAYNMGSRSFQKFSHAISEENRIWNLVTHKTAPPYAAFLLLVECGMLLMIPAGGLMFLRGSVSASVFLLFAYVGGMYLTEILPLQKMSTTFAQALSGVGKVREILELPVFEGGGPFPEDRGIELDHVTFSYDGKTDVLRDCSLSVKQGEKVALVGVSGAGKSTIIQLISRFYDTTKGEVRIGGRNVRDIRYEDLLAHISIVFQKTFLTRDSVLENIRMGTQATLEQVREAARLAQIDDFILSLPQGYDTKVGAMGSRFSGGERQRIAIARAILKDAPILILDEATSAADPENQVEIDRAIENLCRGKTVLIVAHRLGAVKMCDKVAVVEDHTITCCGTHAEVLEQNSYYRKAWADYRAARSITYSVKGGQDDDK